MVAHEYSLSPKDALKIYRKTYPNQIRRHPNPQKSFAFLRFIELKDIFSTSWNTKSTLHYLWSQQIAL